MERERRGTQRGRTWRRLLRAIVAVGALGAPHAGAQHQLRGLEQVEQGAGDTGPLATSRRVMQRDLRLPTGFDAVYRIPGRSGFAARMGGGDVFVRFDRGIAAVFPRSVYTPTSAGLAAEVPPGTVYYIGGLPGSLRPLDEIGAVREPAFNQISRLAKGAVAARTWAGAGRMVEGIGALGGRAAAYEVARGRAGTIWTNEEYRRRRVTELIGLAGRARPGG